MHRVELHGSDPDVVLGGRLLESLPPRVIAEITDAVHRLAPQARVLVARSAPIVGAALLALDALGAGVEACARARSELDAAVAGVRGETRVDRPVRSP